MKVDWITISPTVKISPVLNKGGVGYGPWIEVMELESFEGEDENNIWTRRGINFSFDEILKLIKDHPRESFGREQVGTIKTLSNFTK